MPKIDHKDAAGLHQAEPHVPVLVREVLEVLSPKKGESYLDVTAGYGGHADRILQLSQETKKATLVDRDNEAISALKKRFKTGGAEIIHSDFLTASQEQAAAGKTYDMILADLGVSSLHLNVASRGFAFSKNGPLDMRMDLTQELTAAEIVNTWSEREIADILKKYGEEPKAAKIASAIVRSRPIPDTKGLAEVVSQTVKRQYGKRKIHPATKTFQAIRIAVNDELGQIGRSLPIWQELLAPGGRLAVISFHSLEDRTVKRYFAENASNTYDTQLRLLTKKPLTAQNDEIDTNPRARSAKLRAVVKIKTK